MTAVFFRFPRLSTTTPFRILFPFLFILNACGPNSDLPLLPAESVSATLLVSYGSQENVIVGSPLLRSRPELSTCLHGRPAFYRSLEMGLNVSYCSPSLDQDFQAFLENTLQLDRTAYESYESADVAAYVLTPASLRNRIGFIRLLYCEPDCSGGLHLLESEQTILSRPFHTDEEAVLPRRFYENNMSLAITEHVWLLYRLSSTRILAIRTGSSAEAEQLYRFFGEAMATAERIFAEAQGQAFVSGVYSGDTGGAGQERLILSSSDSAVSQEVIIGEQRLRLFLFPESSVVLRRDDPEGFRFQSTPQITLIQDNRAVVLRPEEYIPHVAVPHRVALKNREGEFLRYGICLWSSPCSPEGIHQSIARRIEKESIEDEDLCTADDISLTEINPFGVIVDIEAAIKTGGKFVELYVSRPCANRSIYLQQAELTIGLPDQLDQGMHVVAGNRSFFNTSVIEDSSLHRLRPAPMVLGDGKRTVQIPIDETALYIYGSREGGGLKHVHSLLPEQQGMVFHVVFHGNDCKGLRPDLCPGHAMTPGHVAPAISSLTALISEILPYLNERFIEIFCNCTGGSGRIDLSIVRLSDGREDHYVFPPPEHPTVTITPTETCGHQSIRFANLYIPASAATYTLGTTDTYGYRELDRWQIDTDTYSKLRKERRSLTGSEAGRLFTEDIFSGCTFHATPGISLFGAER